MDRFLVTVERRAYVMAETATGSSEDALDLVQEAMMTFVQKYAAKPEEEWPPLFFRIVQNKIRDWYRWSKVRNRWRVWFGGKGGQFDERMDADSFVDPMAKEPLEKICMDDVSEQLSDAIKALPLRQQQAFMMRSWEGFSVAETATTMGCSEGSVKTHLSRAMVALRNRLEGFYDR